MGHGGYDIKERSLRAESTGYYTKSFREISSSGLKKEMSPVGVKVRESRDSAEHPDSFPLIIALDVTGSMGDVPQLLVRNGLPHIMTNIIQKEVKDIQVLFLAIGDHECDRAPLQVGQFESSDELLDKWLTSLWFEAGGGGNRGESYLLAHYFAARHTSIDSFEKRGKKGVLITIGDEAFLPRIPKSSISSIMGVATQGDITSDIIKEVSEKYEVYHIHVGETFAGSREFNYSPWMQLLGNRCIRIESHQEIPDIITDLVIKHYKAVGNTDIKSSEPTKIEDTPSKIIL